jgi:hypothetical protein
LIWDNEPGIGRGKRHAEGVWAFTGALATNLQRLKPYDPESKGIVERRNGYFETSFMPGRTFASPADSNTQFADLLTIANSRVVRPIKACPVDLLDSDRAAMRLTPAVGGSTEFGWAGTTRPHRRATTPWTRQRSAGPSDVTAHQCRSRLDGRRRPHDDLGAGRYHRPPTLPRERRRAVRQPTSTRCRQGG